MRWGADDFSKWEAKRLRGWRLQRALKKLSAGALFLALFAVTCLIAWKYLPQSMDLAHIYKQWSQERSAREQLIYYPNCATARANGRQSIHTGEPGYRPALDADHDGIACEPIPPWAQ